MASTNYRLPLGNSSQFKGIAENFSFHASPETFITSRVNALRKDHPDLLTDRPIVRAKILNRNVAVVSSYTEIKYILEANARANEKDVPDRPPFVAYDAYKELMDPFFPSPNVLLVDGTPHERARVEWNSPMKSTLQRAETFTREAIELHFRDVSFGSAFDLYESMKYLSWRILLGLFLSSRPEDKEFEKLQTLHETLLRGQFSLMPISINAGFWQSPRQKGKNATKAIMTRIKNRLQSQETECPFSSFRNLKSDEVANHTLMFTSSLAVKALASLLTAFFLNLYLSPTSHPALAGRRLPNSDAQRRQQELHNVLYETERLSPPIVGVMRRCTKDVQVPAATEGQPNTFIPKGWDVWLYFVGGGRDKTIFGKSFDRYDPDRYLDPELPKGFAFGSGVKSCLGLDVIRGIAIQCAASFDSMGLILSGTVSAKGVRAWLGWEPEDSLDLEDWASDVKQIPTQHPAQPVFVQIEKKPTI